MSSAPMDVQVQYATTRDAVRIAYTRLGEGPPLIFVRGWISHLELLWKDRCFRTFFESLSEHYSVVRYDARGNGLSQRELRKVNLDHLLLDLEAVIDALDVDRFVLFGATFGAPIAVRYTVQNPDRVSHLILDGAFPRGKEITTKLRQKMVVTALSLFPEMAFSLLAQATHPEPNRAPYRSPVVAQQMILGSVAAKLYRLAFKLDISRELTKVVAPTLVMHRRNSQSIPYRLGEEVASLIPNSRFVPLPGDAHNCWEGDSRTTTHAIAEFLDIPLTDSQPISLGATDLEIEQRYRLIERIGTGGMGEVHRARDNRLGREVAVKFVRPEFALDSNALARFELEIKTISQLNHPNICAIYDVGELRGIPFMVMELLVGKALNRILEIRAPTYKSIIGVGTHTADALVAIHENGLVHRDIKPSNLFLTDHGRTIVLDFGLAKLIDNTAETISHQSDSDFANFEETTSIPGENSLTHRVFDGSVVMGQSLNKRHTITRTGIVVGTLQYMSPEQVRGEDPDIRSDLFSLGVVLFEMSTGRRPFGGKDIRETLYAIQHSQPESIADSNPSLPSGFTAIVMKLLEKEPEARYRSASEVAADLRNLRSSTDHGEVLASPRTPKH